jgi:3-oxoadipate enol-lactonase
MIPVSDGEIWAEDTGGDGTPVVFVNPGWSTAGIWPPVRGLLADRFRVIRYDDRGVGRSPAPTVPSTRRADLRAVLDHASASPAVIVGRSGGGTALALALDDPDRVAALVLVAPGAPDYPWPEDDPYVASSSGGTRRATGRGWCASGWRPGRPRATMRRQPRRSAPPCRPSS